MRFDVIGILVNLTGEMASGHRGMNPPDCEGLGLSSRVGLRNLATRPARGVLDGVAAGTMAEATRPRVGQQ